MKSRATVAAGDDHDTEVDSGSVKNEDMDPRDQPALSFRELEIVSLLRTDTFTFTNFPGKYKGYVKGLFNTLKLPTSDRSMLDGILDNTKNIPHTHKDANEYMADFVEAYFHYDETGHKDYHPENGKNYFKDSVELKTPSPEELNQLFERIKKGCCIAK